MAVTFGEKDHTFWLTTKNTSYVIGIVDQDQFVGHIYYGAKLREQELTDLMRIQEVPLGLSGTRDGTCWNFRKYVNF